MSGITLRPRPGAPAVPGPSPSMETFEMRNYPYVSRSRGARGLAPLALLALALVLGPACDSLKGPELRLTTDKTTIAAGGYEYATITATVTNEGKPAVGVSVEFETDYGSFSDSLEMTSSSIATDANGVATIQLWSPADQGQTEVRASYYDDVSGLEGTDKVTITFGPPQAGNLPVDGRFHLDCPYLNLGALRTPKPDIVMNCEINAQTTSGDTIPVNSMNLFFLAEAGVLEAVDDPWAGERIIRYSVRGGNAEPVDVDPIPGEPVRTGSLGEERNPRDGVVTLLAIAQGSESWTDLNGNGVRDENEPYVDLAEPFLDVDDDGVYTQGIDLFFDSNGDGEWTEANGQYDADTFISTSTKVIWSGPLEEAPEAARVETEPASTDIPNGGSLILQIYLLDKNMNPVAAFADAGDFVELDEPYGYVTLSPDYYVYLGNMTSMEFDAQWRILQFLPDAGRLDNVTVADYDPVNPNDPVATWSIVFSATTTAGPQADGYWLTQETDVFNQSVGGTVY